MGQRIHSRRFSTGAGTSFHMNVNEVIANRALEILGLSKGSYEELSPNDHVNRGQSTNDTYPSAAQVAILQAMQDLRPAIGVLVASLHVKGEEFAHLPKAGRTHLKDAMPVTLGQEFHAWATALERVVETLPPIERGLAELPLGGSAVGSGIDTLPGFRSTAVQELARLTGLPLTPARDPYEAMQSRWALGAASGWLRSLAERVDSDRERSSPPIQRVRSPDWTRSDCRRFNPAPRSCPARSIHPPPNASTWSPST